MIAHFIHFLNQIRFFTILYVLQFAVSVNLVTSLIFSKSDYNSNFIHGIYILSVYFMISGWFFIIQEYNYTKIKNISDEYNESYTELINRMSRDKELFYPLICGLIYLMLSFLIIIKLIHIINQIV